MLIADQGNGLYKQHPSPIKEQLYFARNTRLMVPAVVLGTTQIYIKLMYSSMKGARLGNDFILLLQKL
jgi:hypothetical protein